MGEITNIEIQTRWKCPFSIITTVLMNVNRYDIKSSISVNKTQDPVYCYVVNIELLQLLSS